MGNDDTDDTVNEDKNEKGRPSLEGQTILNSADPDDSSEDE
jgi:hypothetical protein